MSTNTSEHVYEIIVGSTPDSIWNAITKSEMTEQYYFGTRVETDWQVGSPLRYVDQAGALSSEGKILEIEPESRLKTTFQPVWIDSNGNSPSTVSWDLQSLGSSTLVKLTHANIDDETFENAQMHVGWVFVVSSLKSLLETKEALPMPAIFG